MSSSDNNSQQAFLGQTPIKKLLWQMSLPMIIAMTVNALYGIVDRAFVGNLPNVGAMAIAGVGIVQPASIFAFAIAMLTGSGTGILISLALGKKKLSEAQNIFNNGVELNLFLSVITTLLFAVFMRPLINFLGADSQTFAFAYDYSAIVIWGFLCSGLAFCLTFVMRSLGDPKTATIFMVISSLINVALDYIFMFVFDFGIAGAAWATVIAQTVNALLCCFYFWRHQETLTFPYPNFRPNWQVYRRLSAAGVAGFSTQMASALIALIANNTLLSVGGNLAVGAMTIINTLSMLFVLPLVGVSQGLQPIIGYNYGAKNYQRVRESLFAAVKLMFIFSTAAFILVQVFPQFWARLFTSDPQLLDLTVRGLRIFCSTIIFLPIYFICSNYYQFIGRGLMAGILSLLRQIIIWTPVLLICARFFGLDGVWWSGPVADTISTVIVALIFSRSYKNLKKQINTSAVLSV